MRTAWFIPIIYLIFATLSLTILLSVEPTLVPNQALFFIVGALIMLTVSKISLRWWSVLLPIGYATSIGLLIFTLFLGNMTRGTVSWIPLGPFHIQPSQIAVPITLFFQAYLIDRTRLQRMVHSFIFALLFVLPFFFIFLEPDLGTSMVFFFSSFTLYAVSSVRKKYIFFSAIILFILSLAAWSFLLKPYQKERITSFLTSTDIQGAGYNAHQSLIAVGSGQWFGRGLGHGIQSQLRFLPEHQTDFVFASIAEETGFLGAGIVLTVYFFLLYRLLASSPHVSSQFASYTLLGFAFLIFFQMLINVGMNMGMMPITGITLPLISYGGSSILSFSLIFGIVLRILSEEKKWESIRI